MDDRAYRDGRLIMDSKQALADEAMRLRDAFDAIERECWSLECKSYRSGGDDADVGWEVVSHHMAEPHDRIEGRGSTPIKAVIDAMRGGHQQTKTDPGK